LGDPRHRWEINNKMDLQEVGCGDTDWIALAHGRDKVAGTCESGNETTGPIKCGEILDQLRTG